MSDRLPVGWAEAQIGDILKLVNGFPFKPTQWKESGLPIVRIQNLNDPNAAFNHCDEELPHKFRVKTGDLLFAWSGTPGTSFGAHLWNRGEAWLNQHIFRVEFDGSSFDKMFLRHAINQNLDHYIAEAHGGAGLAHITKGKFECSYLRIAPLPEQRRIIAKLEAVLSKVDSCRKRLNRIPALLKRFRQAVLAAACSGRLTEDWRIEQPPTRSAEELRADIENLRRKANRKKATECDLSDLPDIPSSWSWASADSLCLQVTDGEHIQPRYQDTGFPMLSAKHVRDGFVTVEGAGLIAESDFNIALARCAPKNRDILVVSVGATTGRSAIVENCPAFAIVRSVLLLKPLVPPRFILRFLQSPWAFRWMTQASGASAQPHLYIRDMKRMPVPVPPLAEQHEIVRRVDQLFALADQVEARYAKAKAHVDKLTQSILAKAFRGELVPQDPNDEPASVMLERIEARHKSST